MGGNRGAAVSGIAPSARSGNRGDNAGEVHLTDTAGIVFRDVEVAGRVHRELAGCVEACGCGGAAVAQRAPTASASHRGDGAGWVHFPDAVTPHARDVEVAGRVHGHAIWRTGFVGERGDGASHVHFADASVVGVGDVEVADGIHRHVTRPIELGGGGGATVSGITSAAGARDGGDRAGKVHPADTMVLLVGDVHVAEGVRRHTSRVTESRRNRRATIPSEATASVSDDRCDAAPRIHPAYAAVPRVRNEDVAGPVHGNIQRRIEPGSCRLPPVPAGAE